ncbi:hypothetical protein [Methylobacterium indicum]|uniref:Uncharacterized protein n=1 Tax=Methylobacterium indicum TaxID=1775910 RepID=A0A8H9C6A9_9HYPH|nr:hypothetical protein [Methylobacterium indicum]BCM83596.1 hypothetical protein mvi_20570 [Methylobacterium indicum]
MGAAFAAPSYDRIGPGTYEIPYGEVLYKLLNYSGGWRTFGDVEMANLKVTATRKQRYAKNGAVSYLALEATTRLDTEFTMKAMQKTDYIRAASLYGEAVLFTQSADPFTLPVNLVPGDLYPIGRYGIVSATAKYTTANGLKPLDPKYLRITDAPLGVVKIVDLPNDAVVNDEGLLKGEITVVPTAITEADGIRKVDIGTEPQIAMEIMVRNLSDVGTHAVLHLHQFNAAGDGELGFISGNDDFEGVTLKGRAAITQLGIGYHVPLIRRAA